MYVNLLCISIPDISKLIVDPTFVSTAEVGGNLTSYTLTGLQLDQRYTISLSCTLNDIILDCGTRYYKAGGWMDGWVDKWIDGLMEGWIDGRMDEWMD